MKYFIFITLVVLTIILTQSCSALKQTNYRITREEYRDSHGNVSVTKYKYDEQNRLIKKLYFDNHYRKKTTVWEYDNEGKLSKITKDEPGKTETIIYEYNALGNVNKEIYTNSFGNKLIKTYEYGERGNIIKEIHQENQWKKETITREFNEDNNIVKKEYSNTLGKSYTIKFTYNDKGQLIKEEKTYWKSKNSDITIYKYNQDDLLIASEKTVYNGNTTEVYYKYDEKHYDKISKIIKTNSTGYKSVTKYLYDEKGRIFEEEFQDSNEYYRKSIYEYTKYDEIKIRKYYEKYYYEIIFYYYERY